MDFFFSVHFVFVCVCVFSVSFLGSNRSAQKRARLERLAKGMLKSADCTDGSHVLSATGARGERGDVWQCHEPWGGVGLC